LRTYQEQWSFFYIIYADNRCCISYCCCKI